MGFRDIRRRFWCPGVHVVRGTCMGVPLAWLSDEVIPMRPHADVPVMFSQSILPAMVIQPTVRLCRRRSFLHQSTSASLWSTQRVAASSITCRSRGSSRWVDPGPRFHTFVCPNSPHSYACNTCLMQEAVARWFFQQLVIGADYCHKRGVANRDIK